MATFKTGTGDWVRYRALKPVELDLHFGKRGDGMSYGEAMYGVEERVEEAVRKAHLDRRDWLLILHGASTSRPGKTTARSVVRGFMRSPKATPYIDRSECIQHETVFVARIRLQATAPPLEAI